MFQYFQNLEHLVPSTFPCWHSGNFASLLMDNFPIDFTSSSIQIDVLNLDPGLSFPKEANEIE